MADSIHRWIRIQRELFRGLVVGTVRSTEASPVITQYPHKLVLTF